MIKKFIHIDYLFILHHSLYMFTTSSNGNNAYIKMRWWWLWCMPINLIMMDLQLRPLRLCKVVPAFDLIMKRVRHLFSVLLNQTIIVCIFIYIFVVFGCRTFGLNYVGKWFKANKHQCATDSILEWPNDVHIWMSENGNRNRNE